MEIGMIGLGKMGGNMTRRLLRGKHRVVVYDPARAAVEELEKEGAVGARDLADLVAKLQPPRVAWVMVPSGDVTESTVRALAERLARGDLVVDGGNSNYKDSVRRSAWLAERGLGWVDAGTSGGIWGLTEGYSLMVGGTPQDVERLRPVLETLAPAKDRGWGRVGPAGAGHFVKMIHNGIEYGMMQAYAEGFAIMEKKQQFAFDLAQIAQIWRQGSVVRSWLLDLTADALAEDPKLEGVAPFVQDSGEGRWTVAEAVDLDVPAPVITLSLLTRLRSRDAGSFTDRVLAKMRQKFGGHAIKKA